jgi:GR25 family glycosyltransferase involved in LPS biosynthesis
MKFTKDNTFCISLVTATMRQRRMQQRFQYFGMNVTGWLAATPDTLVDAFDGFMRPSEKACAQSHINIWRHMVQANLEYALILEDDACFDKEWQVKLDRFSEQIRDNEWNVIMLNASESMMPLNTWLPATEQYMAAGYVLSHKGATQLLEQFQGNFCGSDWMLTRLQLQGHSYCYFPWLIIQEGLDSSIREDCSPDHNKVVCLLKEIDYDLDNYL